MLELHSISDTAITDLQNDTKKGNELEALLKVILSGWPESVKDVPNKIKPYFNFRQEISYENNLLYKGSKVIIPNAQKRRIMQKLHKGHISI